MAKTNSTAALSSVRTDLQAETLESAARRVNFLERSFPIFSEQARRAAKSGELNSEPLVKHLDQANDLTRGLATILQMVRCNGAYEETCTVEEGDEPPLAPMTVDALLGIGLLACEMFAGKLEKLGQWADQHGGCHE